MSMCDFAYAALARVREAPEATPCRFSQQAMDKEMLSMEDKGAHISDELKEQCTEALALMDCAAAPGEMCGHTWQRHVFNVQLDAPWVAASVKGKDVNGHQVLDRGWHPLNAEAVAAKLGLGAFARFLIKHSHVPEMLDCGELGLRLMERFTEDFLSLDPGEGHICAAAAFFMGMSHIGVGRWDAAGTEPLLRCLARGRRPSSLLGERMEDRLAKLGEGCVGNGFASWAAAGIKGREDAFEQASFPGLARFFSGNGDAGCARFLGKLMEPSDLGYERHVISIRMEEPIGSALGWDIAIPFSWEDKGVGCAVAHI